MMRETYPSLSIPRTKTKAPQRIASTWAMTAPSSSGCDFLTSVMIVPVSKDITATGPMVILRDRMKRNEKRRQKSKILRVRLVLTLWRWRRRSRSRHR